MNLSDAAADAPAGGSADGGDLYDLGNELPPEYVQGGGERY